MSEHESSEGRIIATLATFFEKALEAIRPPFMRLLVVFVFALLVALLLVKDIPPGLGYVLFVTVVLFFAFLVAALEYLKMRSRYLERTQEQLKTALRDTVVELQEERRGQVSPPVVQITYVEYDPPGDDAQGEFVRMDNSGRIATDITHWTLSDEAGHRFTFPAFTLKPGAYVRVWTKAGANTATDLYWGREQAVWSNTRDCAHLRDCNGVLIDTYRYEQPSPS